MSRPVSRSSIVSDRPIIGSRGSSRGIQLQPLGGGGRFKSTAYQAAAARESHSAQQSPSRRGHASIVTPVVTVGRVEGVGL